MKAKVIALDGKAAGEIDLKAEVFGREVRSDILQRAVEWQRAKAQAGTHKTKTIGEIRGTTAKPWKQKGTGRARQGSRRSTQFVGGQTCFGPVVRSHATKLTKKFRALALKTALSAKQKEGSLVILSEAAAKDGKTKSLSVALGKLGWKKPLIVDTNIDAAFAKAAGNLKGVDVLPQVGVNVHDILRHKELVLTKAAVASLQERLA